MIKQIAHVCISSTDLAATEKFYCQGLGFEKAFEFVRNGEIVGYYLQVADRNYIEVFRGDSVDTEAKSPVRHFCLEVDDIDAVRDGILAKGYDVTEKKLGADESWQAWVTDPTGVRIEFHMYTEKSTQLTGEACVLG